MFKCNEVKVFVVISVFGMGFDKLDFGFVLYFGVLLLFVVYY